MFSRHRNKIIIMLSLLACSASGAFALNIKEQSFNNVTINICGAPGAPPMLGGCASSLITNDNKNYLVDIEYSPTIITFLKKNGHHVAPESKNITVRAVTGSVVTEKGHFPNPGAEFEVIKITSITE